MLASDQEGEDQRRQGEEEKEDLSAYIEGGLTLTIFSFLNTRPTKAWTFLHPTKIKSFCTDRASVRGHLKIRFWLKVFH